MYEMDARSFVLLEERRDGEAVCGVKLSLL